MIILRPPKYLELVMFISSSKKDLSPYYNAGIIFMPFIIEKQGKEYINRI